MAICVMSDVTPNPARSARQGSLRRETKESAISVAIDLDGSGRTEVSTGLPFFDHMLEQLGRHGSFDLSVETRGDLQVDAHHSVEDTGIALGAALRDALRDKAGIRRFASISLPLDEALVEVALDCSGRPFLRWEVDLGAEPAPLGTPGFDPQLSEEFWRALVTEARLTLHVRLAYGRNSHHIVEATFKAIARALKDAVRIEGDAIPSTKGVL
jgi:imidazoleglycerol-phosphate dehydratase